MEAVARRRLRWRCRRGLLELDVLLAAYLDRAGPALDGEEGRRLSRLLEYPDAELLAWLAGDGEGPEKELKDIVKRIRQAAVYKD